jgi:small ligand-binding sensory domain FIST
LLENGKGKRMIWAGSGLSGGRDTIEAAEEACRTAMGVAGLQRAGLVFCFATVAHSKKFPEMLAAIRKTTACGNVVGCTGSGVLATDGEIEDEPGIAILVLAGDKATAAPFVIKNLQGRDRDAGREIGKLVSPYRQKDSVLVIFPDTLNCNPETLFGGIHETLGAIPVVGGGAADDGSGQETFQFCGGEAISNGVSGVLLTGDLSSVIGVTQSCRPIGDLMTITAARGHLIESLDGMNALSALRKSLGTEFSGDIGRLAGSIFLGFPIDDQKAGQSLSRGSYVVRNIMRVDDESGAVAAGKPVSRGEVVSFVIRDPDGAREDLKAMLGEHSESTRNDEPRVGLYFNCCARGTGLYGLGGIDTAYISRVFGSLPVAGFFGFCEIASMSGMARLHNYAGVMTLISDSSVNAVEEKLQ